MLALYFNDDEFAAVTFGGKINLKPWFIHFIKSAISFIEWFSILLLLTIFI